MGSVTSDVNLSAEGKQVGYLRVAHSSDRSAYGWIPVPVASIRRGIGPRVLVMAGNHGDEYEGQIIAAELIREILPEDVTGHLIILPMANFPAAEAGRRTSPIDGGNLNRSFPGNEDGAPTAAIAHFIEHTLLSSVDYAFDLHSGGTSLRYEGGNMLGLLPRDAEERRALTGIMNAFGLPRALLYEPSRVTITAAARRQGALAVVTELGGAGCVDPAILSEARQGLRRALAHLGLLARPPGSRPGTATRFMRIRRMHYVFAPNPGLFEPLAALGTTVAANQPAARLHSPESPQQEPETVCFPQGGTVVCQRALAKSLRGDCLFQLAEEFEP